MVDFTKHLLNFSKMLGNRIQNIKKSNVKRSDMVVVQNKSASMHIFFTWLYFRILLQHAVSFFEVLFQAFCMAHGA
jgi:hypothetical protein